MELKLASKVKMFIKNKINIREIKTNFLILKMNDRKVKINWQ